MIKGAIKRIIPANYYKKTQRIVYSMIPSSWIMGRDYSKLKSFLKEAQWWDKDRILTWQFNEFKKIVEYAYINVPGYYFLYKEKGIKPEEITTLNDIHFLPLINKELLQNNQKDFVAKNITSRKLIYKTTGGSTGSPLGFYHTKVNIWKENAFIHTIWEHHGWRVGSRVVTIRGSFQGNRDQFWEYYPKYNELNLSAYYLSEKTYPNYLEKIIEFNPKCLQAYPSTATILADYILQNADSNKINIQLILLASETFYEWQKQKLKQAFPRAKLFDFYGHTEQAALASWCEFQETYHVWPFYGIVEVLGEDNKNVNEGERGEIIATSFWNLGTPFIRYQTRDMAIIGSKSCNICGRNFQLLDRIDGRKQDYVIASDGSQITLTALIFAQHFDAFRNIKKMQLFQDKAGEIIVRIIPTSNYSNTDTDEIVKKISNVTANRIKANVVFVDYIKSTSRGKHKFLIQKLTANY